METLGRSAVIDDLWPLAIGLSIASLLLLLASALLIPLVAVRLPADYFVRTSAKLPSPQRRGPWQWFRLLLQNALGGLLAAAGLMMLWTPGPGWMAILLGLALMSFPGKRRLERRLLASRYVLRPLNAIRRRANVPPLEAPPRDERLD